MVPEEGPSTELYLATCWNCLGEFDALGAVWCSDDPKNPTKLCPFCFRCFCQASEKYKQEFWRLDTLLSWSRGNGFEYLPMLGVGIAPRLK